MTVVARKTITGNCADFCISDFDKKATIELRSMTANNFGVTTPKITFAVIFAGYFFIQTLTGSKRFSGVNTAKDSTHLFMARYRSSIALLDGSGEHFIRRSNKLYRVMKITNINENNRYILFECEERGIDTHEETNA